MTLLDPCMSLERIKKILGVLGVVDMCQLLLRATIFRTSLVFGKIKQQD